MWKPEHRLANGRRGLRYPSDLSDAEWVLVAPLIPPARRGGTGSVDQRARRPQRYLLCARDRLPMAGFAERSAAEKHGAFLFSGLGWHVGPYPRGALCRGPRGGWARGEPE